MFFSQKHSNEKEHLKTCTPYSHPGAFCILHINVRSIRNKINVIECHLASLQRAPDLLCFSESWLRMEEVQFVNLSTYSVVNSYCRQNSTGGGVVVLARSGLHVQVIDKVSHLQVESEFEFCVCFVSELNLYVVTIYRPPKGNLDNFLKGCEHVLSQIVKKNQKIVLIGDFNIDFSQPSSCRDQCLNLFQCFNMKPKCSEATRQNRIIDNIITNCDGVSSVVNNVFSDHRSIMFFVLDDKCLMLKSPCVVTNQRVFSEKNINRFKKKLSLLSLDNVLQCDDPALAFSLLYNGVKVSFDQSFPIVRVKFKDKPINGWWNNNLAELRNILINIDHLKYGSDLIGKNNYKKFKKYYLKTIKETKLKFKLNLINTSKNKTKTLWALYKEKAPKNVDNLELVINESKITDPQTIVNIFLDEFTPKPIFQNQYSVPLMVSSCKSMFCAPVTRDEVLTEIKNLGTSKCVGHDGIPIRVLKSVADLVAEPLSHCTNLCFQHGYFPDELKHSIVKPLFKKGEKYDPSNYRGIYLVSNLAKLVEKLMKTRLESFIESNNFLSSHQHGYTQGKSITTASTEFLYSVHTELANRNYVLAVFIDFSKAFDSCNHTLLLNKLEAVGVRGQCLQLYKSYLSNRTQSVQCSFTKNNANNVERELVESASKRVDSGVFAGTICGPLLFNIFLNSIFNFLKGENISVTAYADDLVIVLGSTDLPSLKGKANELMQKLDFWSTENGLRLNTQKTKYMFFRSKQSNLNAHFQLLLSDVILNEVQSFKYLGIHVSADLDWSLHVNELVKRLNKFVFLFRQLRQSFSVEHLIMFYHANCGALLRLGVCFWGQAANINKILLVQKRLIRAIFGLQSKVSCRQYFISHKIPTIFNLTIYEVCRFVHKSLGIMFKKNCNIHAHNTRTKANLQVETAKQFQLFYIKIFNKLPTSLRESQSFTKNLKTLLIKKNYYSLNEFFEDKF